MFLNTLSLGSSTVQNWVKEVDYLNNSRKHRNHRVHQFKEEKVYSNNFFASLPKQPSHYRRQDSDKLYLEDHFTSRQQLMKVYQKVCKQDKTEPLRRGIFDKFFKINNLSLFQRKKDQCNLCIEHEQGNLSDDVWNQHVANKNRIRLEKENDKKKAVNKEIIMITMDLQVVKTAPHLNATAIYFKTKLSSHNFTVFNVANHDCTCYWFTEVDTDLCASTFVPCIVDYLKENCLAQNLPVIIYSDGCTFQNRNAVLANALLNLSMLYNISITQKFFEKGH